MAQEELDEHDESEVAEPTPKPQADGKRPDGAEDPGSGRFARLRKRLLEPRELGEDAKMLIGTVLDSSDRAKTEVVRMVAREVRAYLQELKLTDDLRDLLTSHSLEVNASFSLKPLPDKPPKDKAGKEKPAPEPEEE